MKPSSTLTTLIIALAAPITSALPEPAVSEPTLSDPPFDNTLPIPDLPEPDYPGLAPRNPAEEPTAWCTVEGGIVHRYKVIIKEVDDVNVTCEKLWKGIRGHRFLCPTSKKHCAASPIYKKGLDWSFTVGLGCNPGCVESAFWGATKNKFGALEMSKCPR